MAIHRIDENAEHKMREIIKNTGEKPGAFISQLIKDYYAGLSFEVQND